MGFDSSSGNTTVQLITAFGLFLDTSGPTFTLTGTSSYNQFDLYYNPNSMTADLFVNGILRISNYAGLSLADPPRVEWGAAASLDAGRGNFNSVLFQTTVPEAGSALLIACLAAVSAGYCGVRTFFWSS
jgi:hypothetical protein